MSASADFDMHGSYAYPDTLKRVTYGPGCLQTELPKLMDVLGVKKGFIVTGHSLHTKVRSEASHPYLV